MLRSNHSSSLGSGTLGGAMLRQAAPAWTVLRRTARRSAALEAANARVVTENGAPVTARREAAAPVLRYRVTTTAEGRR
jgi:hypothetical protein